jgi:Domain of unknown function (DUF4417)
MACQECDRGRCDLVCLGKPAAYIRAVEEVGGFAAEDIGRLLQYKDELPRYIPVIQHEYGHSDRLDLPWVALPLATVLKWSPEGPRLAADSAIGLRDLFHLGRGTQVLLLGTGKDSPIERYWGVRRVRALPAALAAFGWSLAVAPNYSFFLDDPRPQHFHNRKRALICIAEWSREGLRVAPYLHGVCAQDYRFWRHFLSDHAEIRIVAKEFQTGAARWDRGVWHLDQIARLQDDLGRELHLIAIGAAQYRFELARRFGAWTIVDSMPFMKAMHRQRAYPRMGRIHWKTEQDGSIASLFKDDAMEWGRWIAEPPPSVQRKRASGGERSFAHFAQLCLPLVSSASAAEGRDHDALG